MLEFVSDSVDQMLVFARVVPEFGSGFSWNPAISHIQLKSSSGQNFAEFV